MRSFSVRLPLTTSSINTNNNTRWETPSCKRSVTVTLWEATSWEIGDLRPPLLRNHVRSIPTRRRVTNTVKTGGTDSGKFLPPLLRNRACSLPQSCTTFPWPALKFKLRDRRCSCAHMHSGNRGSSLSLPHCLSCLSQRDYPRIRISGKQPRRVPQCGIRRVDVSPNHDTRVPG
eukprot:1827434-Rhodomonas_salina.1